MRKTLLLLLLTVIFWGCSSDDSGDSNTGTHSFNPPSWILGKWTMDGNLSSGETGFEFKTNDFCYITAGVTTCIQSMLDSGLNVEVSEEKSDIHYKLNVTIQGTTYKYHFKKISDTVIQEILTDPNGLVSYYRQNNNDEIALPVTFDFTALSLPNGASSFRLGGIEFTTGDAYDNNSFEWQDCIETDGSAIEYYNWTGTEQDGQGIWLAFPNTLIVDVSHINAIHQITVNVADFCGGCARVSLCDENGFVKESSIDQPQSQNYSIILDGEGNKYSKLYISGLEVGITSIRIE